MNSENCSLNSHLLKFISLCNDLRNNLLSNHIDDTNDFIDHCFCFCFVFLDYYLYMSMFTSPEATNCFSIIRLMIVRENKIIDQFPTPKHQQILLPL